MEILSPLYKLWHRYVIRKGAKNLLCKANIEKHIQYREQKDKFTSYYSTLLPDCNWGRWPPPRGTTPRNFCPKYVA